MIKQLVRWAYHTDKAKVGSTEYIPAGEVAELVATGRVVAVGAPVKEVPEVLPPEPTAPPRLVRAGKAFTGGGVLSGGVSVVTNDSDRPQPVLAAAEDGGE